MGGVWGKDAGGGLTTGAFILGLPRPVKVAGAPAAGVGAFCNNACADSSWERSKTVVFSSSSSQSVSTETKGFELSEEVDTVGGGGA